MTSHYDVHIEFDATPFKAELLFERIAGIVFKTENASMTSTRSEVPE